MPASARSFRAPPIGADDAIPPEPFGRPSARSRRRVPVNALDLGRRVADETIDAFHGLDQRPTVDPIFHHDSRERLAAHVRMIEMQEERRIAVRQRSRSGDRPARMSQNPWAGQQAFSPTTLAEHRPSKGDRRSWSSAVSSRSIETTAAPCLTRGDLKARPRRSSRCHGHHPPEGQSFRLARRARPITGSILMFAPS